MRRRPYLVPLVLVLALIAAACGQKEGVHVATGGGGGGGDINSGGGFTDDGTGGDFDTGGDVDTGGDASGGSGDGSGATVGGGGGTTRGGTGGRTGGGGDPATGGGSGGSPTASGGGGPAWGGTIVIGLHAPITGAAPVPSSFQKAAELYGQYINSKGGINGRKVIVKVADDEYQPSVAVTRCRELVQRDNAFLLVGGAGTDQIQACARYAESAGVPYLSAGVTEIGLRGLKGYFAVSMSYKQQGPYLANFIKQKFRDRAGNAAMVYSDTPNFRDARDGFMGAMGGAKEYKLDRVPSSTQLANTARQMCVDGVQVAYPLMAPKDWLIMLRNITCDIQWAGVGLTMGLNTVASTGCKDTPGRIDGSVFFSPFPGIDRAEAMDPQFKEAVAGKNWDDIYVALFSVNRAIGELLRRAGQNLTRAGFVQTAATAKGVNTGLHPPLNYSPDDHFGAQTVHLLQLRCQGSGGQYVTLAVNAKF